MTDTRQPIVGERLGQITALDGVRGLAILLVIFAHTRGVIVTHALPDRLVNLALSTGWVGVDLFFVMSGFLITSILSDARGKPKYFINFYARRALRIFPPYYLTLTILFIVMPLVLDPVPRDLTRLMAYQGWYWTYTMNIAQSLFSFGSFNTFHFWSLCVEEQFYMLWPLAVHRASAKALLRICVAAIILAPLLRVLFVMMHWKAWGAYALMPARMDGLAIGGAMALLARTESGSAFLRRWRLPVLVLSLAGMFAIFLSRTGYPPLDKSVQIFGYSLNGFASGALISFLIDRGQHPVLGIFSMGWLRWIGRCSYGAYIYHQPVAGLLRPLRAHISLPTVLGSGLLTTFAWILLVTVSTLAVAGASFRFFESPFLKLKSRFA